jgi:hypothetical protein
MNGPSRVLFGLAGIFLVAPSWTSTGYAMFFAAPVIAMQAISHKRKNLPKN